MALTERDQLAMAALPTLLASSQAGTSNPSVQYKIVRTAYQIADMMLCAREEEIDKNAYEKAKNAKPISMAVID